MKGLLIKDFKLVKLQKNFFFVIIAVAAGSAYINSDPIFLVGFLTFTMSMFTLSTISYDEFDNGNAFLFTLPVSRKSYVIEKYIFSILMSGSTWILTTLFAIVFNVVKEISPIWESLITSAAIFSIAIMMQAFIIPFHLKFGGEKSRIAIIGAVGIIFIIAFLIVKIAEFMGFELNAAANLFQEISGGMLVAAAIFIAGAMLLISMKISISIMNQKEF